MTYRVTHHHQQGARLAWNDSLFETVEHVDHSWPETERIPLPEVEEIEQEPAQ